MRQIYCVFHLFRQSKVCTIFLAALLLSSQSLLADSTEQRSEAYYLFYPSTTDGKIEQKYQPRSASAQKALQQRPNYLRHDADNPLFKLWLEKEIKKHKNK